MRICPKCGSFSNDNAKFCLKCGGKLGKIVSYNNSNEAKKDKGEISVCAIISIVISIIALCLFFSLLSLLLGLIGLIVGIIAVFMSESRKSRIISFIGIAISLFAFVAFFSVQIEMVKSNNSEEEISVEIPSSTSQPTQVPTNYEDVFYYDLVLNRTSYVNQYVKTSFKVYYCYNRGEYIEVRSEYTDYDLTGKSDNITVYINSSTEYEEDQYITVCGKLVYKDSEYCIESAEVVGMGEQSKKSFQDGLIVYTHYRKEELQAIREDFIASCVEVSYDDLLRYPETYQDVPIRLTIVASDVKADGWIFKGDILAEYQGGELIVIDDRKVREPRLVNGDKVTVYATGDGLGKMKIKEDRFIYEKTVDDYNIPQISLKYTEWDKIFTESDMSSIESDDGDSYDEGERAGGDLAETLGEIDWDENKEDARELGEKAAEYINNLIGD